MCSGALTAVMSTTCHFRECNGILIASYLMHKFTIPWLNSLYLCIDEYYSIYPMLDDMSETQCMLWCQYVVFLSPPLPFKVPLIEMIGVDRLNFWLPDTLCTCRLEDNSGLLVKHLFVLVKTWCWEPVDHWHTIGCISDIRELHVWSMSCVTLC